MNRLLSIKSQFINDISTRKNFVQLKDSSKIDKNELLKIMFGPNYGQRQNSFELLRSYKDLEHYHFTQSSKENQRQYSMKRLLQANVDYKLERLPTPDNANKMSVYSHGWTYYDMGLCVRGGVHLFLYSKAIQYLGTQKHLHFLQKALKYGDIGCFGLTELTHGSNVKGILTEAHYDHKRKQYILNTPCKEAMKFWIGGAAHSANMSVIWAQLYKGEKCFGVHAFIVPIRDKQTHKLLPGVIIGDCGPKNGNNNIDNGFIIFDHVRIPADYQLNKISGVDENGKFKSVVDSDQKRFGMHLAPLSGGRIQIANNCSSMALVALTIGIRYASIRRQFSPSPNKPQTIVMDYPLTKRRLMPLLAQNIVLMTTSMSNNYLWDMNLENLSNPIHPIIQKLHAISSSMKAIVSWFATQAIKQVRQICGGHGFSSYNKLGNLYNDNDVNITWQGDNNVLIQQTSKYVLEQAQKIIQKSKETKNQMLTFLMDPPSELFEINSDNLVSLEKGLYFYRFKLISKIQDTGMKMLSLKQKNLKILQIWNNCQNYLARQISISYGHLYCLQTMIKKISQAKSQTNKQILTNSTILWMLKLYRNDEYIDSNKTSLVESLIMKYSQKLAPMALAILDVISVDDKIIGSPFADNQGRGMDKYLERVLEGEVNHRPEWYKLIVERQ